MIRPPLPNSGGNVTSERTRIKNKGRSVRNEPFTKLLHHVTDSPAWLSLSGNAVKVFVDIARLYNGTNNGYISYAYTTAQKRFGMSSRTVQKVFAELIDRGFIEPAKKGVYRGNATEWRITYWKDDRTNTPPSNEWKNYR